MLRFTLLLLCVPMLQGNQVCSRGVINVGLSIQSGITAQLTPVALNLLRTAADFYADIMDKYGFLDTKKIEMIKAALIEYTRSSIKESFPDDVLESELSKINSQFESLRDHTTCSFQTYVFGSFQNILDMPSIKNTLSVDYVTSDISLMVELKRRIKKVHERARKKMKPVLGNAADEVLEKNRDTLAENVVALANNWLKDFLNIIEGVLWLNLRDVMGASNCGRGGPGGIYAICCDTINEAIGDIVTEIIAAAGRIQLKLNEKITSLDSYEEIRKLF